MLEAWRSAQPMPWAVVPQNIEKLDRPHSCGVLDLRGVIDGVIALRKQIENLNLGAPRAAWMEIIILFIYVFIILA